jgi:HD-GYP domain-containing protein (c-di-GMP phosphodiesterase class II)
MRMRELVGAPSAPAAALSSGRPTMLAPRPAALAPRPAPAGLPLFEELLGVLTRSRAAVQATHAFPWPALRAVLEQLAAADEASDDPFWIAHDMAARAGVDHVTVHHARVAVMALRVGARIGYDLEQRIALGMAGALIDVALWRVPDDVVRRVHAPSAQHAELLRTHARVSAEMVASWTPPVAGLVEAIGQHHERAGGQGSPLGHAQVLGLVDTYAEWTSLPVRGRRYRPHEVVCELMRWRHGTFAPALVKALLSETTVFPPGSLVTLTTGEVGCVLRVNRRHPLRPTIEIISAGQQGLGRRTIDLAEMPLVAIAGLAESATA